MPDKNRTTDAATEALAESWASIDGKLKRFHAGKIDRALDQTDGTYLGYIVEAEAMIAGLRRRGFVLVASERGVQETAT